MIPPTGPFPRSERIRRSREFRDLSRRGARRASEAFVVFTAPTSARDVRARLGITVSRRVGNAVIRNRLKRRIREWYRTGGRGRVDGLDLVVIARPPAARLEGVALRSMLDALVEVPS